MLTRRAGWRVQLRRWGRKTLVQRPGARLGEVIGERRIGEGVEDGIDARAVLFLGALLQVAEAVQRGPAAEAVVEAQHALEQRQHVGEAQSRERLLAPVEDEVEGHLGSGL